MSSGPNSRRLAATVLTLVFAASCGGERSCADIVDRIAISCRAQDSALRNVQQEWSTFLASPGPGRAHLEDLTNAVVQQALRCLGATPDWTPPASPSDEADHGRYLGELADRFAEVDGYWRGGRLACTTARAVVLGNCRDAIAALGRVEDALRTQEDGLGLPLFVPSIARDIASSCAGADARARLGELGIGYAANLGYRSLESPAEERRVIQESADMIGEMRDLAEAALARLESGR